MPEIDYAARFEQRIDTRQAVACVLGLGYVGLPLAVALAEEGLRVIGLDVDAVKVRRLNAGESYVADVPAADVAALVAAQRLSASSDYGQLANADAVIICVPTPLSKTRDPDISHIVAVTEQIAQYLQPGQLVVLESTTYPRHNGGGGSTAPGRKRSARRRRFLPGLFAGTDRPRQRPTMVFATRPRSWAG